MPKDTTPIPDSDFGIYGRVDEPITPPAAARPDEMAKTIGQMAKLGVQAVDVGGGHVSISAEDLARLLQLERDLSGGRHPWHAWSGGRRWIVRRGLHFDSEVAVFRTMLYRRAADEGLRVKVEIIDQATVRFQFSEKA